MSDVKKKPFYKKWWFIGIVVIVLIGAIANMGDDGVPASNEQTNDAEQAELEKAEKEKAEKEKAEQEAAKLLTPEIEQQIKDIAKSDEWKIHTLEEDDGITLWLDFGESSVTQREIEMLVNPVTDEIAGLFDWDESIAITAMATIEGSEKIRAYGNSIFNPGGKVRYMEY